MTSTETLFQCPAVGLFRSHQDAELGYRALRALGYQEQELTLVLTRETWRRHFAPPRGGADFEKPRRYEEGAVVGGIVAALVSRGAAVELPESDLVVAGPLASAFARAAVGAAGILRAALAGLGLSEERARLYERCLRDGGVLLAVRPPHPEGARMVGNALRGAHAEYLYD